MAAQVANVSTRIRAFFIHDLGDNGAEQGLLLRQRERKRGLQSASSAFSDAESGLRARLLLL
jgi:hypothetical protein